MNKYTQALMVNMHERFTDSTQILSAYSVFARAMMPEKTNPLFRRYGDDKLQNLDRSKAKWASFKYY